MLSRKNPDTATASKKHRGYCALRTVGRAGFRPGASCRRNVLHCSSATPVSRRAAARKPTVHRIRRESTLQKDTPFDSLMMASSPDNMYLAMSNHRRSSLPMDYRWLAGMRPKWYANAKKRRSVPNQQETTNMEKQLETANSDNEASVQNSTDVTPNVPCKVIYRKEFGRYDKLESPSTLLTTYCSDTCQAASVRNCQYSVDKFLCNEPEAVLKVFDQSGEKCNMERCYMLNSDLTSCAVILQAPVVPVLMTECSEAEAIIHEDKQTRTVKQHVDQQTMCSVRHSGVDRPVRESDDSTRMVSDTHGMMYKGAACCSSSCDCFHFCHSDSSSVEHETDMVQKNKVDMNGLVMYAGYIGCDGSRKVACDLHLVGALETVSDSIESVTCVNDGWSALAADSDEHEEFVDNICVDCGCELTCDDMTECAYSVPLCSICSLDANHNVPSVDSIALADHGYAGLTTDHLVCPSPLKETSISSSAICQQPDMPDIDVVDDVTFLSFPSKLLMHKYIMYQQNICDPTVKNSWMELARCERSWHGSHKSHRSVWFGSMRHRHIDRFSAHNRLNEQIELGLVKPVSTQNSADLLGIKIKTSLSQNNTDKTAVARKLKCRNRHVSSDLRIQRPTRVAATGQHYCLTRFWPKRNTLKMSEDAEHVAVMKLTQQQAEEALKLLNVPSVITRNNCHQPGCHFGCICNLFTGNRFASVIGAEFRAGITVPEYPVIDDSWRQSLLSSADSSFASNADDSLHQLTNSSLPLDTCVVAAASSVLSTTVNSTNGSWSGTAVSASLSALQGQKYYGKRTAKARRVSNMYDSLALSPPTSIVHKRPRLKCRLSPSLQSVGDDGVNCGASPTWKQLKQHLSQTMPSDNHGHIELGEIHTQKRRRLKGSLTQTLPLDSADHVEHDRTVVRKRRRRLSANKASLPRTEDASQAQLVKAVSGRDVASDIQISRTSVQLTNSAIVTSSASRRAQLHQHNLSTDKCYILKPVVKGAVHSSAPTTAATVPVSTAAATARCRLVLPPECRISVLGSPSSAAIKTRLRQSSETSAEIPRLVRLRLSPSVSSSISSSNSSALSLISNLLKHHSSAPASVLSPSSSSNTTPSSSSAFASTLSILKRKLSSKSASLSSPSHSSTTSVHSNSTTTLTQSMLKHQTQPFRTQMILFQQKQDNAMSGSGPTRLLEVISDCDWERIRPQVLARLSHLTENSEGYPQTCVMSIDGFRLEVQPRRKLPTEIPMKLQVSLGVSSMFAIRVRITDERKLLPTTGSASVPVASPAAESSAQILRVCNGLNVRSLLGLSVGGTKHQTTADVTQPISILERDSTAERTTVDSSQKATATTDTGQQSTSIDASQKMLVGTSANTDLSSKDAAASVSKSAYLSDDADGVLEKQPEPLKSVETIRSIAQDARAHCSEDTGSDMNGRVNSTHFDNSGNCTALQQQAEDTAMIKNGGSNVGAECTEVANKCLCDDDKIIFSSSSSAQTLPADDCSEVACSLQADDGNFPSSSGLNVPIACPLDLRT